MNLRSFEQINANVTGWPAAICESANSAAGSLRVLEPFHHGFAATRFLYLFPSG